MILTISDAVYLTISMLLTIWVAETLHRTGRVFLLEAFPGDAAAAGSFNRLRVVGFYLVNLGFAAVGLPWGTKPKDLSEAIEYVGGRIGLFLLVLGVTHFFSVQVLLWMRHRAVSQQRRG